MADAGGAVDIDVKGFGENFELDQIGMDVLPTDDNWMERAPTQLAQRKRQTSMAHEDDITRDDSMRSLDNSFGAFGDSFTIDDNPGFGENENEMQDFSLEQWRAEEDQQLNEDSFDQEKGARALNDGEAFGGARDEQRGRRMVPRSYH